MARDYAAEMTALIEDATQGGDWVPSVLAGQLCDRLSADDPDLLAGWLHTTAVQTLTDTIRARERSVRTRFRARAGAHAFAAAAATGDPDRLRAFAVTYAIDEDNTRRRVADMRGTDHAFVAGRYAETANRARMLAAFHTAVAKKVGDRRTADVLTEAQYERMYASIVGPHNAADVAA